jgi:hypothetical protein
VSNSNNYADIQETKITQKPKSNQIKQTNKSKKQLTLWDFDPFHPKDYHPDEEGRHRQGDHKRHKPRGYAVCHQLDRCLGIRRGAKEKKKYNNRKENRSFIKELEARRK